MYRFVIVGFATLAMLYGGVCAAAEPQQTEAKADDVKKIVLIWTKLDHPYASHMYKFECELLAKCLNQTPGVEAIVSPDPGWPKDPEVLKDVKAIAYYSRSAGDIVFAPERREQFEKLMKSGVGFACIHWATAADDINLGPDWLLVLGGWFNFAHCGLKVEKQRLTMHDPKHPICRGWEEYDLHDEFYLNLKFHERARPLLSVTVNGKQQIVAWTMERPGSNGGRSFGSTLGHFHENFRIEAFRRALVNGILWTAHVEIPETGAPVEVTEADLTLPPKGA